MDGLNTTVCKQFVHIRYRMCRKCVSAGIFLPLLDSAISQTISVCDRVLMGFITEFIWTILSASFYSYYAFRPVQIRWIAFHRLSVPNMGPFFWIYQKLIYWHISAFSRWYDHIELHISCNAVPNKNRLTARPIRGFIPYGDGMAVWDAFVWYRFYFSMNICSRCHFHRAVPGGISTGLNMVHQQYSARIKHCQHFFLFIFAFFHLFYNRLFYSMISVCYGANYYVYGIKHKWGVKKCNYFGGLWSYRMLWGLFAV